ncbi:MAG: hypothetical protein KC917_11905, partial [Candidatus Omnitrophica bacterium]|nr:hypothetical protein [Candidatus Omnitrophota bacterium]
RGAPGGSFVILLKPSDGLSTTYTTKPHLYQVTRMNGVVALILLQSLVDLLSCLVVKAFTTWDGECLR